MKKILLLHGWNYLNYTSMTKSKDAWENREKFVKLLSKKYKVYKLNFPGFCGEKEPNKPWNLKDYAEYVKNYIDINNLKVDYILGYSFGGAVAVEYSKQYDLNQELILISPAIIRDTSKSKKFIKTPKILNKLRSSLRNIYLKKIIKNPYMINGTKFLNESYQRIVRVSLLEDLELLDSDNITIIYGELDNMVNPNKVINTVDETLRKRIHVIKDGDHDIANTHPEEIIKIIKDNT